MDTQPGKGAAEAGRAYDVTEGLAPCLTNGLDPRFHPEGFQEGAPQTHIPAGSGSKEMSQESGMNLAKA